MIYINFLLPQAKFEVSHDSAINIIAIGAQFGNFFLSTLTTMDPCRVD